MPVPGSASRVNTASSSSDGLACLKANHQQVLGMLDHLKCLKHNTKSTTSSGQSIRINDSMGRQFLRSALEARQPNAVETKINLEVNKDFLAAAKSYAVQAANHLTADASKSTLAIDSLRGLHFAFADYVFDSEQVPKYCIPTGSFQFDGLALALNCFNVSTGRPKYEENLSIKDHLLKVCSDLKPPQLMVHLTDKVDWQNKEYLVSSSGAVDEPLVKKPILPTYSPNGPCRLDNMVRPFVAKKFLTPEKTRNGIPMRVKTLSDKTLEPFRQSILDGQPQSPNMVSILI